ncbi:MAG TPA: hypothetical protein VGJ15_13645 [Pirellulales bacterium]|jgi:hypothetical protein
MPYRFLLAVTSLLLLSACVFCLMAKNQAAKLQSKLAAANNEIEAQMIETAKLSPALEPAEICIDLQAGFHGEEVTIKLDGRQIYTGQPTTNEIVAVAAHCRGGSSFQSPVIRIAVPRWEIDSTFRINLSNGNHVGLSISNQHKAVMIQAQQPFGYD